MEVTPNSDGTHTFKVPEEPSATVIFNQDDSYTFTDTESPGMVLYGEPDGIQGVTDEEFPGMAAVISPDDTQTVTGTEFPGMAATLSQGGELTITDAEFPGMTYTVNLDDVHIVTDTASPDTSAVINENGTYTVTDTEFPGVDIVYNPDDETYTVSDVEFPGAKIIFSPDGSYTVVDQDGNCYDVNKNARRGWFKKFVNKAARAVSKVAGFVKKTARFVKKVAKFVGKAARFVSKVAKFVAKAAPVVSKVFRAIGAGALFIGTLFPPLCPVACAISGFANAAAAVSAKVGVFAGKVAAVADKVAYYSGKVEKYAGKVEKYAGKVQIFANRVARWSRNDSRAGERYRRSDPQNCEKISLYKAFGTITDNAGNPMVNISVKVRDITETSDENVATTTDNTGYWEVIGLSDGDYTTVAQKQGCIFTDTPFTIVGQNKDVAIPCDCETFVKGLFTVGSDGIVSMDWLYDGGAYRGELGIFEVSGMENLITDLKEFIAEAVRRVMSDSEQGYLVLSDPNEGARFSGQLGGEPKDWNSGRYNGVKSFQMSPDSRFATILVPNSTFQALAKDPGTASSGRRPLFSLVSSNPAYGMYLGQVADIDGMGKAFVYEDIWAANSDKDYNDLIIQVTGASADDIPSLDSLMGKNTRTKHARKGWVDWRTEPGLGRQIMEHLEALDISPDTLGISVTLKSGADLLIYDPLEREISKEGGYIPGATYASGENGYQVIKLPELESGDYRIVLQGLGNGPSSLEIKGFMGNSELGSQEQSFAIQPHQTMTSIVSADSFLAGQTITFDTPAVTVGCNGKSLVYDFDGDRDIDIADVMKVVSKWGTRNGVEEYDGFYDFDDDGYIRLPDIMKVVNLEGCKQ